MCTTLGEIRVTTQRILRVGSATLIVAVMQHARLLPCLLATSLACGGTSTPAQVPDNGSVVTITSGKGHEPPPLVSDAPPHIAAWSSGTVRRRSDWALLALPDLVPLWADALRDGSRYDLLLLAETGSPFAFAGELDPSGGDSEARKKFVDAMTKATSMRTQSLAQDAWEFRVGKTDTTDAPDASATTSNEATPANDPARILAAEKRVENGRCEFQGRTVVCVSRASLLSAVRNWLKTAPILPSESTLAHRAILETLPLFAELAARKPLSEAMKKTAALVAREMPRLSFGMALDETHSTFEVIAPLQPSAPVGRALVDGALTKGAAYNDAFDRIPDDATYVFLVGEGIRATIRAEDSSSDQEFNALMATQGTVAVAAVVSHDDLRAAKAWVTRSPKDQTAATRIWDALEGYEMSAMTMPFADVRALAEKAVAHTPKRSTAACPSGLGLPTSCFVLHKETDASEGTGKMGAPTPKTAATKSAATKSAADPTDHYFVADGRDVTWEFSSSATPAYLTQCIRKTLAHKPGGAKSLRSTQGKAVEGFMTSRLGSYWSLAMGASFTDFGQSTKHKDTDITLAEVLTSNREEVHVVLGPSTTSKGSEALRLSVDGAKMPLTKVSTNALFPLGALMAVGIAMAFVKDDGVKSGVSTP